VDHPQELRVTCHCGWTTTGVKDTVVASTQEHVLKVHWTEADEEDVLAMAEPA
jgi:hypothetical protein